MDTYATQFKAVISPVGNIFCIRWNYLLFISVVTHHIDQEEANQGQ